jgi:hypothetical protein
MGGHYATPIQSNTNQPRYLAGPLGGTESAEIVDATAAAGQPGRLAASARGAMVSVTTPQHLPRRNTGR